MIVEEDYVFIDKISRSDQIKSITPKDDGAIKYQFVN